MTMIHTKTFYFILLLASISLIGCTKKSIISDGYLDKTTYFVGETMTLFLNADRESKSILTITDVNGNQVDEIEISVFPQTKRADSLPEKGFGYKATAEYLLPDLPSGLYYIDGLIGFIVSTKKATDITFVYPINTLNAYCNAGGMSLYTYQNEHNEKANQVSFLRPMKFEYFAISQDFLKWLKAMESEYSINYISDREMDDYSSIEKSKLLIIPGHSEYWTRQARENFDRFIDSGKDACVFSGNTMWWQVRYDGDAMVCYKNADNDPDSNALLKTLEWSVTSLQYPIYNSIGVSFDYGGYGTNDDYNGFNGYKILKANSPIFKGTNLKNGDIIENPTAEYDGVPHVSWNAAGDVQLDTSLIKFHKLEVLAYDLPYRWGPKFATFIAFQRGESSGKIINTASTNWLSSGFTGKNKKQVRQITKNAIDLLLNKSDIFTSHSSY